MTLPEGDPAKLELMLVAAEEAGDQQTCDEIMLLLYLASQAEAIELQGTALLDNPTMMQWTFIQEWNGTLPVFMTDSGLLPILPLDGIIP